MPPGPTRELTVLVVDDDFMVATIHAELVTETDGFRVAGTAGSGAKALEMVAAVRPDLLLLDVHLPDMSGLDVLKALRERGDDVDAIVVTAERDAEYVKAALRGGASQYLVKPFDLDDLQARIRKYAGSRVDSGKADQQTIDAVFSGAPGRTYVERPLPPKGLSNESLDLVRKALADGEEYSATTCGEATGMARPTVRRYLEYLVKLNEVTVRLKYGGGRPERMYRSAS
ncbi:response regulator [Mycobacterium sp. 236(2023)]|uniref:response regulator n=1 Tax=Mycobacterium sp. 236(2023) TaxID=3038163 RepID=UPI002415695B|nr:response regulator [Mycobacterium sp. 236(2023)]MDG4668161.1 response regulator [Mycobacterium sp. 236(2023)]